MDERYGNSVAARLGTEKHEYAHRAIKLGILQKRSKATLNQYINESIGHKLTPEQMLYYSDNCFGTADAIGFRAGVLRIFDYKSGVSPTKVDQLLVYAALFCLEYNIDPITIEYDLRIYQSDDVQMYDTDPEDVVRIMKTIVEFDKRIEFLKSLDN